MSNGVKKFVDSITDNVSSADIIEAIAIANVCAAILEKRLELDMNQKQFAEYMGISQSEVSKLENGDSSFKLKTLAKIADKLEIPSIERLVGEKRTANLRVLKGTNSVQESFWNKDYKKYVDIERKVDHA